MKASGKINHYRRKIMKSLTGRIGSTKVPKRLKAHEQLDVKRVLICRPNHRLGNLVLITPLIQEVEGHFPEATIDLLVQGGVAPILFKEYSKVDRIIQLPKKPFNNLGTYLKGAFSIRNKKYDFVINAVAGSSSGKIYTWLASAKYKVFDTLKNDESKTVEQNSHIAKNQVYNFRNYLKIIGLKLQDEPVPTLSLKLNDFEIQQGKEVLKSLVPSSKKTLSIYTFATGNKCYSKEWWQPFYERLQAEFGAEYNMLEILPIENVSQIDFNAPTYYSKDIREMTAVMANTEIYIGADCGIMHLASAAQIPVLGLFSRPNILMYEPYGNKSIGINTNVLSIDDYIDEIKKILG